MLPREHARKANGANGARFADSTKVRRALPDFVDGHGYPALVSYAGPPQQPLAYGPPHPPIQKKVRKVGAPLGVLILLGTIAGLIVIALTAFNPVGTSIGFVLSSVAMTVVLLAYLWLDRWEPEPPRLLILAFLWGASVAVIIASILQLVAEAAINPGRSNSVSPVTVVLGAPLTEEAAKGLFLLLDDDRHAAETSSTR